MTGQSGGRRRGGQNGRWKGWRGLGPDVAPPRFQSPRRRSREPMNDKQAAYLRALCERAGEPFDATLTKSQASARIDALRWRRGGKPSQAKRQGRDAT